MGSWNETCALSNLPIPCETEVVWLLITVNPYKGIGTGCYLSDYYFVRTPPLFGVYDDYGRVELHEGQELLLDEIQKQFAKDLLPHAQTDRTKLCRIPPVGMEDYTFAQLQDWLHEGHVYVDPDQRRSQQRADSNEKTRGLIKNQLEYIAHDSCPSPLPKNPKDPKDPAYKILKAQHDNWELYCTNSRKLIKEGKDGYYLSHSEDIQDPAVVQRIMVRRDVWDIFLTRSLKTWQGILELGIYKTHADQFLDTLAEYFEECANASQDELDEVGFDRLRKGMALTSGDNYFFEMQNLFLNRFGSGVGGHVPPFGQHPRTLRASLSEALQKGETDKEQVREIFHRLCDLAQVEDVMSASRMCWHPAVGSGSQDEEYELSMELHLAMAACAYKAAMAGYEECLWDEGEDPSPKLRETWKRYPKRS